MFTAQDALRLVQESFDGLAKAGTLEEGMEVSDETVLLGAKAALDSIAFVTFLTDFEDRLQRAASKECYLKFHEISDFDVKNPSITVKALVRYTVKLVNETS